MHEDGAPVAKQINGQDGKAWRLPLPPLSATSLPEAYSPGEDAPRDRAHAAYRLAKNHAAVARFAARGAGQPGPRPVWAPLSDPSAVPNDAVVAHVDLALTCVAQALLSGVDAAQPGVQTLAVRPCVARVGCSAIAAMTACFRRCMQLTPPARTHRITAGGVQEHVQADAAVEDVRASLAYLRDRVGVPRDMPLPAARQLRAHFNWCIDELGVGP
jgi:glutathione S-transferase